MELYKVCYKCGENKLESEYYPSQFKILHGKCRFCKYEEQKDYKKKYREKNKE